MPDLYLFLGQTHIHHLNYGIFLLSGVGAYLLLKTLPDYLDSVIDLTEQNHDEATFTKMIKKEDALIDWNDFAKNIHNKLRAYTPWPGIYTFLEKKRLKILKTEIIIEKHKYSPGQVIFKEKNLLIACGENLLKIDELQLEGKKPIDAATFINGYKKYENEILV